MFGRLSCIPAAELLESPWVTFPDGTSQLQLTINTTYTVPNDRGIMASPDRSRLGDDGGRRRDAQAVLASRGTMSPSRARVPLSLFPFLSRARLLP